MGFLGPIPIIVCFQDSIPSRPCHEPLATSWPPSRANPQKFLPWCSSCSAVERYGLLASRQPAPSSTSPRLASVLRGRNPGGTWGSDHLKGGGKGRRRKGGERRAQFHIASTWKKIFPLIRSCTKATKETSAVPLHCRQALASVSCSSLGP